MIQDCAPTAGDGGSTSGWVTQTLHASRQRHEKKRKKEKGNHACIETLKEPNFKKYTKLT